MGVEILLKVIGGCASCEPPFLIAAVDLRLVAAPTLALAVAFESSSSTPFVGDAARDAAREFCLVEDSENGVGEGGPDGGADELYAGVPGTLVGVPGAELIALLLLLVFVLLEPPCAEERCNKLDKAAELSCVDDCLFDAAPVPL